MTAFVLACAMLLDAMLGEPDWLWSRLRHPAVLMGDCVRWLDMRLNRGRHRRLRGIVAVAALGSGALALGGLLSMLGPVAEILACAILLAQRSLVGHVTEVADALRLSLPEARRMVARIVTRDTADMDGPRVARSAIESAAENLSDGVIAPAFWFLVGGLPGLLFYKAINTADSMIGYLNDRYARFGWAAARLDDLLNLVPARLTCILLMAVSGRWADWRGIVEDAQRHVSPNAGWPEAAMARALNIALAGPRSYHGRIRHLAWVNEDARKDIGAREIERAATLLWQVWSLALGLVMLGLAVALVF
ncbi:adenosylcobinamide-phosphate synthase [Cribrihabitans marinus]|uniref:Cobalamin biosynthesis protein CobD n=1 Tax=Cribrihabitans marinus TaxID=1227549 RepID=A0A1H7DFB4_9RHOB|nr:adenosylcobinamide-phosphate synthase CbiB [Cribrihabitans marinus]GGH38945.1 cobalamin biosynthesis protein CobD [Cribrihabitans marinus]SEK00503.1 adenosylcobinamide-phosphate synthase [Cribrihabitans marinus]